MGEHDDLDFDFDEELLKDTNDEDDLFYTQRDPPKFDEIPPKRRRINSPPIPRQVLKPLSTLKHGLLDIFSNEPASSPLPPRLPAAPHPTQKVPKLPQNSSENSLDPPKTPQRFPRPAPKKSLDFPRNSKNSLDSPRSRQALEIFQKPLVRKFPGPAGLLPDGFDASTPPESLNYICLLDDNDAKVTKKSPEKLGEFCTQDTQKIFLEGAWMRMMDTLPAHFVEGYDIASIIEEDAKKVPRLAVVIQKIDSSSGNPRVILKDISGSIQGMMDRDLAVNYPHILKSGVVLLLQDVGVLTTKKSFVRTRTIIFSSDNLIAAFSEKGVVVTTPFLDAISAGTYDDMRRKMAEGEKKKVRKWGENLSEKLRLGGVKDIDRSNEGIDRSKQSIDRSKQSIDISKPPIDRSNQSIDISKQSIDISKQSIDISKQAIDISKESIVDNQETIDNTTNSDDFCEEDFNFDDDLFHQIDVSQFDLNSQNIDNEGEQIVTSIAATEQTEKEKNEAEVDNAEICGFADDLLNDTDSDDEFLSQIDLDAISRSATLNS